MDESEEEGHQEDSIDEVLAQAELLDNGEEEEEPPKKKRKTNKDGSSKKTKADKEERSKKRKKKKKQSSSSSSSSSEVELSPEDQTAQNLSRKQLKILLLKNPNLNVAEVMKTSERVNSMPIEEVNSFLEAAKMEMGLKKPLAVAENCVGLIALAIQRYMKSAPDLYRRLMQDHQLIAAVDEFAPNFGDTVNNPLQILVRLFGHVSDVHYGQSHFSTIPPSTE